MPNSPSSRSEEPEPEESDVPRGSRDTIDERPKPGVREVTGGSGPPSRRGVSDARASQKSTTACTCLGIREWRRKHRPSGTRTSGGAQPRWWLVLTIRWSRAPVPPHEPACPSGRSTSSIEGFQGEMVDRVKGARRGRGDDWTIGRACDADGLSVRFCFVQGRLRRAPRFLPPENPLPDSSLTIFRASDPSERRRFRYRAIEDTSERATTTFPTPSDRRDRPTA